MSEWGDGEAEFERTKGKRETLDFPQVLTCRSSWQKARAERGRGTHSGWRGEGRGGAIGKSGKIGKTIRRRDL